MPAMIRIFAIFLLLAPLSAWAKGQAPEEKDDALTAVLAGEFAYQAGQLPEAARWYLQAAREGDDAGLAERATRIALLAGDDTGAAQALRLWRARAPESLAMGAAEATLALRRDASRVALRELRALLAAPEGQGWRYALRALASGGKDPALSARLLGRLMDEGAIPDNLQAWLMFAGLAQQLDQPDLAERMVADTVRRFPNEPRVALLHASQLRNAGRKDEARQVLLAMHDTALLVPELRLSIAAEYDAMGDARAAAGVLALGDQDNHSYALRASLLAKVEDKEALAALYEELRVGSSQPDPARRLLLGQVAEFLEHHEDALVWYRSVPGGQVAIEARLRAANVLYTLGRKEDAFAEVRAMQRDAAIDEEARRAAYLVEAELHQKGEGKAEELDALARGLAAYPDDPALLYARGLTWERRDDIERAEADFRRILVTDPENVAALNALGYTLADRTTRYQEALELIDRARAAQPENAAIIDSYGWVLYRLGRHEEALVHLRHAFTLMKDPEVAAHIGEVLWVLGRQDEARHYFDEARKLDPENRSLLRALELTGA